MAVPLQAGVVEQMGIKRSTDKVDAVSGAHTFFGIVCLCGIVCHVGGWYICRSRMHPPLWRQLTLQIRLPKSAGDALMSQDAPKNGAMLFELSTSVGRSLHAGVLDFSAAQGTVGVPEHLIRNLWGLTTGDGQCHGHVVVTYKKLPKGTLSYTVSAYTVSFLTGPYSVRCVPDSYLQTSLTAQMTHTLLPHSM